MTTSTREHWQDVYEAKAATEVSWYAAHLHDSLRLIREVAPFEARILDVGAGASTLVDDLLDLGYRHITLLDVSAAALTATHTRLGERAQHVTFRSADITTVELEPHSVDLWHDRAVFHFLTREDQRHAYVQRLRHALAPGGHLVIATFALAGPQKCSGLDVMRYDAATLASVLGPDFELTTEHEVTHTTPAGKEQRFQFCRFKKLR